METKKLEKIVRGFSNHRRIQILELLEKQPELSVLDVSNTLHVNFKTISEHLRRLAITGLVLKQNIASEVQHTLSSRGRIILKFLRTLE